MDYLEKIRTQIKWLVNQILCMNLRTGNADMPDGSNGSLVVSEGVKFISAYEPHLEFVDSPESISNIKGHTVLKLTDEFLSTLNTNVNAIFDFNFNNTQIKLGWKNGGRYETSVAGTNTTGIKDKAYTRNGFIRNIHLPLQYLEIKEINNLIVQIPNYAEIASFNPRLLIYRYKPSKKKGVSDLYPSKPVRTTANFKLHPNYSDRPTEIALNAGYQLLDIGQEHYFSLKGYDGISVSGIDRIVPKGIGKRNSNKYLKGIVSYFNAWVYLEFRIKITKDGIDYITKPLNKVKMILSVINTANSALFTSKIKFKFT